MKFSQLDPLGYKSIWKYMSWSDVSHHNIIILNIRHSIIVIDLNTITNDNINHNSFSICYNVQVLR